MAAAYSAIIEEAVRQLYPEPDPDADVIMDLDKLRKE
jgi:hypothetical protein